VTGTFFGLYRGVVQNNVDPQLQGRVQISVPEVYGDAQLPWAEPCIPYAGKKVGNFALPPVGTSAWVQFERGDPDYPILAGCKWEKGESPAPGLEQIKMIATDSITITLSDAPGSGGLTIEVKPPAVSTPLKLVLGPGGIELSNGGSSIKLDGVKVSLNNGALEVT
jgi:Type VI secretion system/phage-baseplate injector OB domain